jgi:hypothetical protein
MADQVQSWSIVLGAALGSGAGAAVSTQIIQWMKEFSKDRASEKREARHVALSAAVGLEQFSLSCSHFVSRNNFLRGETGDEFEGSSDIPTLGSLPPPEALKGLDPSLAARLRTIFVEVESAKYAIAACSDLQESPIPTFNDQATRLAWRAFSLAEDLRKKYELDAFPSNIGSDLRATVYERYRELEQGASRPR